jgi:hypothetical protein
MRTEVLSLALKRVMSHHDIVHIVMAAFVSCPCDRHCMYGNKGHVDVISHVQKKFIFFGETQNQTTWCLSLSE